MNCEMIFYSAHKTALCEKALKKTFSELNIILSKTSFATNSVLLGNSLVNALKSNSLVFIIGGLELEGNFNTVKIFERAFADNIPEKMFRIKNENGEDGYVFATKNQMIILFPDYPEQIQELMQGYLYDFIKNESVINKN